MRLPLPSLWAAAWLQKVHAWTHLKSGTFEILVLLGVVAVLTLALFVWAVAFRQPARHHQHHHHSKPAIRLGDSQRGSGRFSRRRSNPRRKSSLPSNPTLAQTRGLPAVRDGQTPPRSQL